MFFTFFHCLNIIDFFTLVLPLLLFSMIKNSLFFLAGVLLTCVVIFFTNNSVKNSQENLFSKDFLGVLWEVSEIVSEYRAVPDISKTQESLLQTFVQSYGDPYTAYLSREEASALDTMIGGDFEWIGAYIEESPNGVFVQSTLPGSPAQEWGLLPGDVIQSINGKTTFNMTADAAVLLIRWTAGTPVVLDIFSTALSTKKQVTLIRRKLELLIVTDELLNDILYIHLFSFNDYSGRDVEKVLKKYEGKYKKILFDLRDNGGGTLDAAVDVASLFFSAPKIVSTIEWKEPKEYLSKGEIDVDIPVYILVNWQTASAAEILASALHKHLKAPVLGTQTYWKGSVQELFSLSNGAQIKVTVAQWLTATGEKLDGKGITPDTVLLPKIQDLVDGRDGQKEEALEIIKKGIK